MAGKVIGMGKKLVFDLETKKTFDEVGGHQNAHLLGMSVCGVYDYDTGKYKAYKESDIKELEQLFSKAELLIGFNSKHFDNTVLQPYFNLDLKTIPHLDILEEVVKSIGFRLKLESLAQSILYSGKSGSGLDAIKYLRNNEWDKLISYCLDDVRVTKDIYEYGKIHGQLWYSAGGKLVSFQIPWAEKPSVVEVLQQALQAHQQIEIEYIKVEPNETRRETRQLDLRAMDKERIKAYDLTVKAERIFLIPKIFSLKIVGEMSSFQAQLF